MTTATRIVFGLSIICAAICAQTAQINGVVKDSAGLVVPGAQVKLTGTATGAVRTVTSAPDGEFTLAGLSAGTYALEITKQGFNNYTRTGIVLRVSSNLTINASLVPSINAAAPSLGDLGFTPEQTKGNAQAQALLDRRTHMLKVHQRLGLITAAPLLATLISASGAHGRHSTASGRDLHAGLGIATAGLYFTAASFAIRAPSVPGTTTRGPIRLHKALAWIHGPGMILTPILGAMAFAQLNRGERVHGIAKAHSVVAWATAGAYGAAILSISIKF